MARIRTVKPAFWTDGKNNRLSDSCALFFIGLWNFCDDEGKHPYDLNQLVAELGGRWHRGKVKLFIRCLIKSHQLRINSTSTWIQVVHFSHQKIDKPIQPNVKAEDLQWVTDVDSWNETDHSRIIAARIGKDRRDRIGWDISSDGVEPPASAPVKTLTKKLDTDANRKIWDAYKTAYVSRYGVDPVRNAKVNSNVSQLRLRVGETEAPKLVSFYLSHNDNFYIRNSHSISLCVRDCESLMTQMHTGQVVTTATAKMFERDNELAAQIKRLGVVKK